MSRAGDYSQAKRQREAQKAKKAKEKAERKARKKRERDGGSDGGIPVASVDEIQTAATDAPARVPQPGRGAPARQARPSRARVSTTGRRLFVGGISWDTDERMLKEAFAAVGEVEEAIIIHDRDTGRSRGFGFVTMASRDDAAKAIERLDGEQLDGRRIKVSIAVDRR